MNKEKQKLKQNSKQKPKQKQFSKRKPKKAKSNRVSEHFSKRDFVCKESGEFKISLGLVGALEQLRFLTKKRITIIKGYEPPEVAEKKGKIKRNYHTKGIAADIQVDNLDPKEAFIFAETIPEINGIGLNIAENYIHVDTRKEERTLWIEEKDSIIELNEENRSKYLDAPQSSE